MESSPSLKQRQDADRITGEGAEQQGTEEAAEQQLSGVRALSRESIKALTNPVHRKRQEALRRLMAARQLGPAELARRVYPDDKDKVRTLATRLSNARGGHTPLNIPVAKLLAPHLGVDELELIVEYTDREQAKLGRESQSAPTPVDPAAEKTFRKDAFEWLVGDRGINARQVAYDAMPGASEEERHFFAMSLAEARIGDVVLPFRDARRIELCYGLAPKTLWSGLTREEIEGLTDSECAELFPSVPEAPKREPMRKPAKKGKAERKELPPSAPVEPRPERKLAKKRRVAEGKTAAAEKSDFIVQLDAGPAVIARLVDLNRGALQIAISRRGPRFTVSVSDVLLTKEEAQRLIFD